MPPGGSWDVSDNGAYTLALVAGQVAATAGNAAAAATLGTFRVDLYLNPSPAPTAVNQIWPLLACQGATWGVAGGLLPIAPGGRVTLMVGDGAYRASLSSLPASISAGARIYAQADSANATPGITYGAILESHERNGGAYNNVIGPVRFTSHAPYWFVSRAPPG